MKKYVCIGGPLNNKELTTEELNNKKCKDEYVNYNISRKGYNLFGERDDFPTMIRVHSSILPESIKKKT